MGNNKGLVVGLAAAAAGYLAIKNLDVAPELTLGGLNMPVLPDFNFPEFGFDLSGIGSLLEIARDNVYDRPKEFINNVVDDTGDKISKIAGDIKSIPEKILEAGKDTLADFALDTNVLDIAATGGLLAITGGVVAPAIFSGINLATRRASGDSLTSQLFGSGVAEIVTPGIRGISFPNLRGQLTDSFTELGNQFSVRNILGLFGISTDKNKKLGSNLGIGIGVGSGDTRRVRNSGLAQFSQENALTRAIQNRGFSSIQNSAASPGMDRPSGGSGGNGISAAGAAAVASAIASGELDPGQQGPIIGPIQENNNNSFGGLFDFVGNLPGINVIGRWF